MKNTDNRIINKIFKCKFNELQPFILSAEKNVMLNLLNFIQGSGCTKSIYLNSKKNRNTTV